MAATNEDPWAHFDAEKTSVFTSQNEPSSAWAASFLQDKKGANPVIISGPSHTTTTEPDEPDIYQKHRASFAFDARHQDELSLSTGEIVWVKPNHPGAEPGWVLGIREDGNEQGWFPLAYVEQLPDDGSYPSFVKSSEPNVFTFPDTAPASDDNMYTNLPLEAAAQPQEAAAQSAPEILPDDDNIYENINDITSVPPSSLPQSGQSSFTAVPISGSPTPGQVGWFPKSFVKVIGDSVAGKSDEVSSALGNGSSATPTPMIQEPDISGSPAPDPTATSGVLDTPESYVAVYTYSSVEPGDLTFNQGDDIWVTKKEADWWTGSIGDRVGIFPANYVKESETPVIKQTSLEQSASTLTAQKASKSREIATVIAPYQATGAEQLSLQIGQLINVRKKNQSGWWEGELQARGQKRKVGWFPANYVQLLSSGSRGTPSDNRKSLSPTQQNLDSGSRSATPVSYPQPTAAPSLQQVVATFTYQAQHADELSFEKNSVINVLNKDDADWWRGELNGSEGMFPANYVVALAQGVDGVNGTSSPAPSSSLSGGNENKRQSAIYELIQTEEAYMADLKLVYDVFYKPLVAEKALNATEMEAIFVNWRELITCNKKLLMALKVRKKTYRGQNISYIGDVLCENFPHMTAYIRFCSCQLNASTTLHEKLEKDSKFRDLHQKAAQDPRVMGMPLSSYYLKPMQRIIRYPMLIEKILRNTSPDHADHVTLSEAHSKATELCNQVNEGVREKENSDKLEWIQTHVTCDGLPEKITFNSVTNCLGPRKYLYSGSLYKNKSGKELAGFLFNDFLLLAQPQSAIGGMADVFSFDIKANVQFKMYRNPIFLNEVMVKKPANAETDPTLLTVQHTDKDYNLKAITTPERDTWFKKIEEAAKFFRETERKRKEKAHLARGHTMRGCGRLLVIMLEGCNLIASDANGKSDPYCEVNMGVQEHKTKVINNTLNPKWNHSMQFTIKNLEEDVLCITVYDRDLFSPNDFLGRTEIRIKDIISETKEKKGPLTKRLKLYEVESGEVTVKLDLQIFDIEMANPVH